MSTLTYVPVLNGAPYDPEPAGGTVLRVELYTTDEHDTDPAYSAAAQQVSAGRYQFTIPDTVEGRYWPRVVWLVAYPGVPQNDDLTFIDLPVYDDLVVSPEELGDRLGLEPPLEPEQRNELAEALRDAQVEVEAYLGRPILPGVYEEIREWPAGGSWDYSEQPVIEVLSETPEVVGGRETGRWVVRYRAGLDARSRRLRPIRRRILQQAMLSPSAVILWRTVGAGANGGARRVTSMSVEGQSASFQYMLPNEVTEIKRAPLSSEGWPDIDRWRLVGRRIFERRTANRALRVDDVTDLYG